MTRDKFIDVVKAFSWWQIDECRGNYILPSGSRLSDYLYSLIHDLLERNKIAFRKNGDLGEIVEMNGEKLIFIPFGDNEKIEEEDKHIIALINEMLYQCDNPDNERN